MGNQAREEFEAYERWRQRPRWVRVVTLALYALVAGYLMYLGVTYARETGEQPGNYRN